MVKEVLVVVVVLTPQGPRWRRADPESWRGSVVKGEVVKKGVNWAVFAPDVVEVEARDSAL